MKKRVSLQYDFFLKILKPDDTYKGSNTLAKIVGFLYSMCSLMDVYTSMICKGFTTLIKVIRFLSIISLKYIRFFDFFETTLM